MQGNRITVAAPYDAFHVYAVGWTPERMGFFVDDRSYFTFENEGTGAAAWPFDQPHCLVLNGAVGGGWGGRQGVGPAIWLQRMEVDYARVYQRAP